jgi:hypothetical protein
MSTDNLGDVEIKTGGYDASLPMGNGIQLNIVTPSGGNEFHGKVAYAFQPTKWNGDNSQGTFLDLGGVPTVQDVGILDVSVGGPIARDRVWFFTSFRDNRIKNFISRSDEFIRRGRALVPNYEDFTNDTSAENWFVKVTSQLNQNHNLLFSVANDRTEYQQNHERIHERILYNATGGFQYTAKLNSIWSTALSSQFVFSYNDKSGADPDTFRDLRNDVPQTTVYARVGLSGANLSGEDVMGTILNDGQRKYQVSSHLEFKGDITYFMQGGGVSHEFKTGFFIAPRSLYDEDIQYANNGFYSEDRVLTDPNDITSPHIAFRRQFADPVVVQISRAREKDFAFYIQDQWKPIDRLTLNLGLRVDWVRRHDDLFNLTRQSSTQIAPRFGFSLMLDQDANNVIRGSFVRLHAGMTGRDGPTRFVTASRAAIRTEFDNNLDGVFETVQQSLRQTESLVAQRFDPELSQPYIDEFIVAYRRQFPGQVVLDIAGTLKHVEDNFANFDINGIYPAGPGLPFLGFGRVDPNRGRVTQQTNNSWSRNNLWATDFTLTKNMTNNFMLYSTLGLQNHSISGDWNPTDPSRFISPEKFPNDRNLEDTRGNGDGNSLTRGSGGSVHVWQDYSYNFAGTWDAPGGIKLSSGYTLHQGRYTGVVKDRLAQADPTYGPTRFTLPNGTTQPNPLATRFRIFFPTRGEGQTKAPNIHSLNVKIGKVFQIGDSQSFEISGNITNFLNNNSFYRWGSGANRIYVPRTYLKVMTSLQPARALQLFLKYEF